MPAPHFSLDKAIRPNVFRLPNYTTSTSDEAGPRSSVLLDANENSLGNCLRMVLTTQQPKDGILSEKGYLGDGYYSPAHHYRQLTVTDPCHRAQVDGRHTPPSPQDSVCDKVSWRPRNNDSVEDFWGTDAARMPSSQVMDELVTTLNRYPSAAQAKLKNLIVDWKGLPDSKHVCLGVGAADLVDLLIRVTCTPGQDAIMITPPTFNLYAVRAALNDVSVVECPLALSDLVFSLDQDEILGLLALNPKVKLIFLASPGNPTGSLIPLTTIVQILSYPGFDGILVVDEAYIELASDPDTVSAISLVLEYPNLVVLSTLSKSQGLAGLRLGMAFAQPPVIQMLDKMQMPYAISTPTSILACLALTPLCLQETSKLVVQTKRNRAFLVEELSTDEMKLLGVGDVLGGNNGNFVLFQILDHKRDGALTSGGSRARNIVEHLKTKHSISVRHVGNLAGCGECVRATVGTELEQMKLLEGLKSALGEYGYAQ